MPYHNLDEFSTFKLPSDFDYTIIGAGAAGILLAVRLSKLGHKVLLIESGNFEVDEDRQKFNTVIESGKKMNGIAWGRKRAIGGTTVAWGGQSLPFSETDFLKKEWLRKSGWPIKFEELLPYYENANIFMGIDTLPYQGKEIFGKIKLTDPGIDNNLFDYHVSKWAKQPNFRLLYHEYLRDNITILYNAFFDKVLKEGDTVEAIEISDLKKNKFKFPVKHLIIAAGGVETNRILLSNKTLFEEYKNYNLVGKGFMDHPCIAVGKVRTKNPYRLQKYFNTHHIHGKKVSIRLSLSKEVQIKEQLLNCSGSLLFVTEEGRFDPYAEIKALSKKFNIKSIVNLSGSILEIGKSALAYFKDNFFYKLNTTAKVVLMIEQEALDGSKIDLAVQEDEIGQKQAVVNWDISFLTWKTAVQSAGYMKKELERLGFGQVEIDQSVDLNNPDWKDLLSDVNHHMGGCIMSQSPADGIVDKNLKIWGIQNMFVSSCAVFPTSSHSNPTLTLLALSERLANYLHYEKNS
jgi:choline dehydrogenase-like flavoprotein